MSAGVFLSRILGLVREQVFAFFFGASNATDAFQIAFRIPNLLRDLLAEGAMNSALVPTYVESREKHGKRRSWQVAGRVFRVLLIVTFVLVGVGYFFSDFLVGIYASAFKSVPGKFELTVGLTGVLFFFLPFVTLAAAFMGVLNANGFYFIPAFASAMFNASSIVCGVILTLLAPKFGYPAIYGMAYGVVIGGLVQALVQVPSLRKVGYRFPKKRVSDPSWKNDPALKQMLFLILPALLGLAATQVNILVNSVLATSAGTGAVSWLNYSFRLMQFPIGVFGVSLAAAFLPSFSRSWVNRNKNQSRDHFQNAVQSVMAINLPAAAGLGFLSIPIIQMIFEYGEFSHSDTIATATALTAYCIGLPFYSIVKVLVPMCYAMGKTKFAVGASVVSVAVNIGVNLWLIKILGYWGLALGTSIAAILQAGILFVFVHKQLTQEWVSPVCWHLVRRFLIHFGVSLGMGWSCLLSYQYLSGLAWFSSFSAGSALCRVFVVGILILQGVLFVYGAARLFRLKETIDYFSLIRRKYPR